MSKNKFLNHNIFNKTNIALICILVMFAGYLVSRVALSLGMMVFGLNALIDVNPRRWLQHRWCMLGFAVTGLYAITYFWSIDTAYWNVHTVMKSPLLLLPLSFAFLPRFTAKQYQVFTAAVAVMLLAGAAYSVSFLVNNVAFYKEAYRTASVLPTPGKDYVRFSLTIALFVIWCFYVWPQLEGKFVKWFTAISMVLLVVYLHVLASKTGLLSIYIFFIAYVVYYVIYKKKVAGIFLLASLAAFLMFANKYIPTFHERLGYISFTYQVLHTGEQFSGQYGDIERLVSYDIASKYIMEHPLIGVGVGSMYNDMVEGYERWYPNIQDETTLIPHNQFLIVAMCCGIPAAIVFVVWCIVPFTWVKRSRNGFFLLIVLLLLFLQLMIEPVLEIQFGVFVYMFFLLWQKHTLATNTKGNVWFKGNE